MEDGLLGSSPDRFTQVADRRLPLLAPARPQTVLEVMERIDLSMTAADESGDMVESPVKQSNRLLFTHHLAVMIGAMH